MTEQNDTLTAANTRRLIRPDRIALGDRDRDMMDWWHHASGVVELSDGRVLGPFHFVRIVRHSTVPVDLGAWNPTYPVTRRWVFENDHAGALRCFNTRMFDHFSRPTLTRRVRFDGLQEVLVYNIYADIYGDSDEDTDDTAPVTDWRLALAVIFSMDRVDFDQ